MVKTFFFYEAECPFRHIANKAPKDPARYAEVTDHIFSRRPGSDHGPTGVVIPSEEVSLCGTTRVNRVIDDRCWRVHNLLTCAEKPRCEFSVFTSNAVILSAHSQVKPEQTVSLKHLFPLYRRRRIIDKPGSARRRSFDRFGLFLRHAGTITGDSRSWSQR